MAETPITPQSPPAAPPSAAASEPPRLHAPSDVDPRAARVSGKRRPLGCVIALLAAIVVCAILGVVGTVLWRSEPEYWQEGQRIRQRPTEDLQQIAVGFEQRLAALVSDADQFDPRTAGLKPSTEPGPPRTVDISLEEINAWLATRLDWWMAREDIDLPRQVRDLMVTTEGDRMIVAFKYDSPEVAQVVSGVFRVRTRPDGLAVLTLDSLRAGKLPIPAGFLPKPVQKNAAPQGTRASKWLTQLAEGYVVEPRKIDAVRQWRLLDLKPHGDGLRMTVQTEPRKKPPAATQARSEPRDGA